MVHTDIIHLTSFHNFPARNTSAEQYHFTETGSFSHLCVLSDSWAGFSKHSPECFSQIFPKNRGLNITPYHMLSIIKKKKLILELFLLNFRKVFFMVLRFSASHSRVFALGMIPFSHMLLCFLKLNSPTSDATAADAHSAVSKLIYNFLSY